MPASSAYSLPCRVSSSLMISSFLSGTPTSCACAVRSRYPRGPAANGRALAVQPGQALTRGAEAAGRAGEPGPGILAGVDPGAYRRHRERGRIEPLVLDFGPAQRGG